MKNLDVSPGQACGIGVNDSGIAMNQKHCDAETVERVGHSDDYCVTKMRARTVSGPVMSLADCTRRTIYTRALS